MTLPADILEAIDDFGLKSRMNGHYGKGYEIVKEAKETLLTLLEARLAPTDGVLSALKAAEFDLQSFADLTKQVAGLKWERTSVDDTLDKVRVAIAAMKTTQEEKRDEGKD